MLWVKSATHVAFCLQSMHLCTRLGGLLDLFELLLQFGAGQFHRLLALYLSVQYLPNLGADCRLIQRRMIDSVVATIEFYSQKKISINTGTWNRFTLFLHFYFKLVFTELPSLLPF